MNRALALASPLVTAKVQVEAIELARRLIVLGCAAALILAGELLPF